MQSSPAPASCDARSLWFTAVWFRRVTWWEKRGSCWGRQTEGSVLGLRNTAAAQLKFTDAATGTGPVLQTLISLRVTAQQSVFFRLQTYSSTPHFFALKWGADPHRLGFPCQLTLLGSNDWSLWRWGLGRKGEATVFLPLPLCLA